MSRAAIVGALLLGLGLIDAAGQTRSVAQPLQLLASPVQLPAGAASRPKLLPCPSCPPPDTARVPANLPPTRHCSPSRVSRYHPARFWRMRRRLPVLLVDGQRIGWWRLRYVEAQEVLRSEVVKNPTPAQLLQYGPRAQNGFFILTTTRSGQ